jgi:hypothetical protein
MTSKPTVFAVHALALLATIADTHAPAIRGDYADITGSFSQQHDAAPPPSAPTVLAQGRCYNGRCY